MRNVLSISVILTGTSLVAGLGAVTLAAHEIVRQVRLPGHALDTS